VDAKERYFAALHAMQSGVALQLEHNPSGGSPKHLRVGVNSAKVEHAALAKLLIDKGIITEAEYTEALAEMMEREVRMYEDELTRMYGGQTKITLG
jgi:hypothetical protein